MLIYNLMDYSVWFALNCRCLMVGTTMAVMMTRCSFILNKVEITNRNRSKQLSISIAISA